MAVYQVLWFTAKPTQAKPSALLFGIYAKLTRNTGRAINGEAMGTISIGVWGVAPGDNSTGVYGQGANYDFYTTGPD